MRSPMLMDNIQIEITNACINKCSNCTRFCGHFEEPYFMDFETFKQAVDSVKGYPKITGIMGGEPLLHPQFEQFCDYAREHIGYDKLGLWTSLPRGKERYREVICKTFKHIFLNDHTRHDIYHHPILVAANEIMEYEHEVYMLADQCWVQNSWSASINPYGAYFCEVAAAFAMLLQDPSKAWPVDEYWWWKTPKDFKEQIEAYCKICGGALPLRRRVSTAIVDDVSPENLKRLQQVNSPKVRREEYVVHDLTTCLRREQEPMASYKSENYRQTIAERYGMFLTLNDKQYFTPHLITSSTIARTKSLLEEIKERWQSEQSKQRGTSERAS